MYPFVAQQGPLLTMQQPAPILGTQAPAPFFPTQTTPAFDISSIINLIVPIMGLALVMGMMMPMMKSMTEGFGNR